MITSNVLHIKINEPCETHSEKSKTVREKSTCKVLSKTCYTCHNCTWNLHMNHVFWVIFFAVLPEQIHWFTRKDFLTAKTFKSWADGDRVFYIFFFKSQMNACASKVKWSLLYSGEKNKKVIKKLLFTALLQCHIIKMIW